VGCGHCKWLGKDPLGIVSAIPRLLVRRLHPRSILAVGQDGARKSLPGVRVLTIFKYMDLVQISCYHCLCIRDSQLAGPEVAQTLLAGVLPESPLRTASAIERQKAACWSVLI
jgi:hypothetical protein